MIGHAKFVSMNLYLVWEDRALSVYINDVVYSILGLRLASRDDHYPVCLLDIRQDSEFATRYGYPKTAFKREPDTDPYIRNAFIDNSDFWKKLHIAQSFIYYLQKHLFTLLCHDSQFISGVISVL